MPFQLTHFRCFYINMSSKEQKKADKQVNSQWKTALSRGARLVIITVPWICRPIGRHYAADGGRKRKTDTLRGLFCTVLYCMHGLVCISQSPQSFISIYLFGSFSCKDVPGLLFSVSMNRFTTDDYGTRWMLLAFHKYRCFWENSAFWRWLVM